MVDTSVSHGGLVAGAIDGIMRSLRESLLAKALAIEAGLVVAIVLLAEIGGVYTNHEMTGIGFVVGVLGMAAIILGAVILAGVAGFAAWMGYRWLAAGHSGTPG